MIARVPALLAAGSLAVVASLAAIPGPEVPERITSAAVWTPPEGFVAAMHRACDAGAGGGFGACFVEAMRRAGAPDAAVAFAHRTGDQGYLTAFREAGAVGVACAEYPFRANENAVCFLVDGAPPMVDVDDPRDRDESALKSNAVYAGLLRRYPHLAIFPGPRSVDAIATVPGPGGATTFRVEFVLVDGCHACERVGALRLDFDFDASARFAGTRIAAVRAARPR
jgi:hypothetical protein